MFELIWNEYIIINFFIIYIYIVNVEILKWINYLDNIILDETIFSLNNYQLNVIINVF